jgi:hypothetical protein
MLSKNNKIKDILIYLLITFILIIIMETSAWTILQIQKNINIKKVDNILNQNIKNVNKSSISINDKFSSKEIENGLNEHVKHNGSPWKYMPYTMYGNREFHSKYVNIDNIGIRQNSSKPCDINADYLIFIIGSSVVFGVTNADSETISSYLEAKLNKKISNQKIAVCNLGVASYSSFQDYLNLKIKLIDLKPNLVIVFNGYNDLYIAWESTLDDRKMPPQSFAGMAEKQILDYYWNMHAKDKLINTAKFKTLLWNSFSNTIKLISLGNKWLSLKSANSNLDAWKLKYKENRDKSMLKADKVITQMNKFYIENMAAINSLSKIHDFELMLVQQPSVFNTAKKLTFNEKSEYINKKISINAFNDDELADLNYISSHMLKPNLYINFDSFINSLDLQKLSLEKFANENDIKFVDINKTINNLDNIRIFSSHIHLTAKGSQLIGEKLADELSTIIK